MESQLLATFLSPIAASIIDALDSSGMRRLKLHCAVEKHLDNLKIAASRVVEFLGVVLRSESNREEDKRLKPLIKTLEQLQNVICSIDDEVDEPEALEVYAYSGLELSNKIKKFAEDLEKVAGEMVQAIQSGPLEPSGEQLQNVICSIDDEVDEPEALEVYAYSGLELSNKIKKFAEDLEKVAGEMVQAIQSGPLEPSGEIPTKESNGFLAQTGKDLNYNYTKLIDRLKECESANRIVSFIAVTGIGGIGKTTLVKHFFDSKQVNTPFQLRIWVDVCGPFDERSTIQEMLMSASGGRPCDLVIMQTLQEKLEETLRGMKFLLVLDDVQIEDVGAWESFSSLLETGEKGSVVVMTSRSDNVAESVRTIAQYKLDSLSSNNSWKLIRDIVFRDKKPNAELEETCKKIIARLNNLPLAVKTFAELIKIYNMDDPKKFHKAGELLRELDEGHDSMSVLLNMYFQSLPLHLKQCLMYCSLFPKGHRFDRTDLAQQWIALGFVRPKRDELVEDVAGDYFSSCQQVPFFRRSTNRYVLNESVFSFTQPMFDASPSPGSGNRWQPATPKSVIHLALRASRLNLRSFMSQYTFGHLRSLVYLKSYKSGVDFIDDDMLTLVGALRVLDLSHSDIQDLPDSVAKLRHLRYLNLSFCRLESLPDSVSKLTKLQTLDLSGCYPLCGLPQGLTRLTNLRCLRAAPELVGGIAGIGKLSMLQKLEEFEVHSKPGFKIQELMHLKHLQGRLCIRNLENVGRKEAEQASLDKKPRLRSLRLVWNARAAGGVYTDDEQVLSELKPHDNIKELHLENYGGSGGLSWLTDCKLDSLEVLTLKNCHGWKHLPGWHQLKSLRFLELDGLDGVIRAGTTSGSENNFSSLQELKLSRMPNWEEWQGFTNSPLLLPSLSLLVVTDCPKLTVLPQLPSCLRTLRMERVGLKILPDFEGSLLSLVSLFISDCEKLTNLSAGLMQCRLGNLQVLNISNCRELSFVPLSWFGALTSLKSLTIKNCPKLNDTGNAEQGGATLFEWLMSATYLSSVSITKDYSDLSACTKEAVQYLTSIEALKINGGECETQKVKDPPNAAVTLSYEASRKEVNIQVGKPDELMDSRAGVLIGCLKRLLQLEINGCPDITTISGDVLSELGALKKLSISCCANLISVGVQALITLESLVIYRCSSLKSFVENKNEEVDKQLEKLESLRNVVIFGCSVMAALPPALYSLPALEYLHIVECPAIKCLPDNGLPESLKELVISACPTLVRSVAGKDATKIALVPFKFIDHS